MVRTYIKGQIGGKIQKFSFNGILRVSGHLNEGVNNFVG